MENITLIGAGTSSKYADLRDGLIADLNNVLAYGFAAESTVNISGADSATELAADRITFSNWEIVVPEGTTLADTFAGDYTAGDETKFTTNATAITSATEASEGVGADLSVFSWALASSELE